MADLSQESQKQSLINTEDEAESTQNSTVKIVIDIPEAFMVRISNYVASKGALYSDVAEFVLETLRLRINGKQNKEDACCNSELYRVTDNEMLLDHKQIEDLKKKARLEGALGYIKYLCEGQEAERIKSVNDLTAVLKKDANSAFGSLLPLLRQELKFDGFEYGLMEK